MVNQFEVKRYLCEELGLTGDALDRDIRKRINDIIWCKDSDSFNTRKRCVACILLDMINSFGYDKDGSGWVDPENAHTIKGTYFVYRYLLDENGRSEAGITLSAETLSKICLEVGINKICLGLSGNWSNSANFMDKAIRSLRNSGWIPRDYQDRALVLILEKEE